MSLDRLRMERRWERGWRRFDRAAGLADGGAESPQESRLRVRLVLAGLPRPVTQHEIRHDGRFVARADLAWPQWRVAVEYDGAWHDDSERFHRDRERLNRMQAAGWVVLLITARRFHGDFDGFVAEVRTALRAASKIHARF
jgi:very-short-patch-repair endonuclease